MKLVREHIGFERDNIKDTLRVGIKYNFEIGNKFEVLKELKFIRIKKEWLPIVNPKPNVYVSGSIKIGSKLMIKKMYNESIYLETIDSPLQKQTGAVIYMSKENLGNEIGNSLIKI